MEFCEVASRMRRMNIIRSRGHELFTEEIYKIALSAKDDKTVIRSDGGHYRNE